MEVLISTSYGGYGVTEQVLKEYKKRTNTDEIYAHNIPRHCPVLLEIVKEIGLKESSSEFADLSIEKITGCRYLI